MKTDLIIYIVSNRVYRDCVYIENGGDYKIYLDNFIYKVDENTIFKKLQELLIINY